MLSSSSPLSLICLIFSTFIYSNSNNSGGEVRESVSGLCVGSRGKCVLWAGREREQGGKFGRGEWSGGDRGVCDGGQWRRRKVCVRIRERERDREEKVRPSLSQCVSSLRSIWQSIDWPGSQHSPNVSKEQNSREIAFRFIVFSSKNRQS